MRKRTNGTKFLHKTDKKVALFQIHLLLKHTKNTNICDRSGRTALHIAILYGQVPSVEPLLKHGFDPNLPDKENQMTPMLIACESERPEFVDCLLKHVSYKERHNQLKQLGWKSTFNE